MDLDEWIFYEKRNNKDFSLKAMAKELKVSLVYLRSVRNGSLRPSSHLAVHIEKYTRGEVSGWETILRAIDIEEEKNEKGNSNG